MSKYQQIYQIIRNDVVDGKYSEGEQIPTESELASRFSTTRKTVARALHKLEDEGVLLRRRGLGTFVKRAIKKERMLLGLLVVDIPGVFINIIDAITQAAQANGYGLLLGKLPQELDSQYVSERTDQILEQFISNEVSGVIVTPYDMMSKEFKQANIDMMKRFRRMEIPAVMMDRDIYDYPLRSAYDLVWMDSVHAGYVLTRHLLSLGYERIGFVGLAWTVSTITARMMGYQKALTNYGIEPDSQWIYNIYDGKNNIHAQVRDMTIHNPCQAYVCANDLVAMALIDSLGVMGMRVPEDVAVVGVDDTEWFRANMNYSLTTIRQPCSNIGRAAVKMVLERIADPDKPASEISFQGDLIVRTSCGSNLERKSGPLIG